MSAPQLARRIDPFPVQPPYHGIYAHAVETAPAARTLHISGQVGLDQAGNLAGGFEAQCHQALDHIESILMEAGMTTANLVKMTFLLIRRTDMDTLVDIRRERLEGVRPAVTTVFVAGLVHPDWLIEIEAVAASEHAS